MENEDVIEVGKPPYVYKTIKWILPALPSGLSWEDAEIGNAAVWGNGHTGQNVWITGVNLTTGHIAFNSTDQTARVKLYLTEKSLPADTQYGVLMRYTVTDSSGLSNYFVTSGMGVAI